MNKAERLKKYDDLGITPPGAGHDVHVTYHETVRNMVSQGRATELPAEDIEAADAYFADLAATETGEPVTLKVGE